MQCKPGQQITYNKHSEFFKRGGQTRRLKNIGFEITRMVRFTDRIPYGSQRNEIMAPYITTPKTTCTIYRPIEIPGMQTCNERLVRSMTVWPSVVSIPLVGSVGISGRRRGLTTVTHWFCLSLTCNHSQRYISVNVKFSCASNFCEYVGLSCEIKKQGIGSVWFDAFHSLQKCSGRCGERRKSSCNVSAELQNNV